MEIRGHADEVLNLANVTCTGKEGDLWTNHCCEVSVAKLNTVEGEMEAPTFKSENLIYAESYMAALDARISRRTL